MQAQEISSDQVALDFSFGSDWLKRWRESIKPIIGRGKGEGGGVSKLIQTLITVNRTVLYNAVLLNGHPRTRHVKRCYKPSNQSLNGLNLSTYSVVIPSRLPVLSVGFFSVLLKPMAIVYVISLEKSIENIPNKLQCTLSGWHSVWWYALMYAQPLSDISILFFANFQHLINLLITLYSQGYSLTHLILLPKCN